MHRSLIIVNQVDLIPLRNRETNKLCLKLTSYLNYPKILQRVCITLIKIQSSFYIVRCPEGHTGLVYFIVFSIKFSWVCTRHTNMHIGNWTVTDYPLLFATSIADFYWLMIFKSPVTVFVWKDIWMV